MPLLPLVIEALAAHRNRNQHTKWVFEGPSCRPLDLATLRASGSSPYLKRPDSNGMDGTIYVEDLRRISTPPECRTRSFNRCFGTAPWLLQ